MTVVVVVPVWPRSSVADTVTWPVPDRLRAGVTRRTRLAPEPSRLKLAAGKSSGLSVATRTVTLAMGVSASSTTKDRFVPGPFSFSVASGRVDTTGVEPPLPVLGSTVSENGLTRELPASSVTMIPMVAAPERFAAGVTVTVRSAPEPPKTMLPTGTSNG